MTSKRPPRIATWMLKHFGCGPNNDALLGDLAEQFAQQNNAAWYWRQAMKAIPVSLFKEMRGHKRVVASVLLSGWSMWILYTVLLFNLVNPYFLGTRIHVDLMHFDHPVQRAWSLMWAPVLGQAGLKQPFSYLFAIALPLIVGVMVGKLIARFHRQQQTGAVLLFSASMLLINGIMFGPFILTVDPRVTLPLLAPLAANVAAAAIGILLGGGLLRRTA